MEVQSILFDINKYNITESRKWLKDHGYKYSGKVHTTACYHRFRQLNPNHFDRFVNKKIKSGIILVLAM